MVWVDINMASWEGNKFSNIYIPLSRLLGFKSNERKSWGALGEVQEEKN